MASIMTEQTRMSSVGSAWSSRFSFTSRSTSIDDGSTLGGKTSWQGLFRKRKRTSPSPSRRHRSVKSMVVSAPTRSSPSFANGDSGIILSTADLARVNQLLGTTHDEVVSPIHQNRRREQPQQKPSCIPSRTSTWPGRRPSAPRLRELCPARDIIPEDLENPPELSRPYCRRRVGNVWQPHPEPGWRVATKPRSPASVFKTVRPIYAANIHSPLVTGKPFTAYFEGEIRPGDSEDAIRLALGFVAGDDEVSKMPGCERWSIGIQCSEGRLFVNGNGVESVQTGAFGPGHQLGIGLTYAVSNSDRQTEDSGASIASPSSINVEVFVTRDGKKIGSWNLCDQLRGPGDLSFEGLEGQHDLYAAVGTVGEANIDILLEQRDWLFEDNLR